MKEHVGYEYAMMQEAENIWTSMVSGNSTTLRRDVLVNMLNIAGFVNAQNLLNFLIEKEIELPKHIKIIAGKIDVQIKTLTENRTSKFEEKLHLSDLVILKKFIEAHREVLEI